MKTECLLLSGILKLINQVVLNDYTIIILGVIMSSFTIIYDENFADEDSVKEKMTPTNVIYGIQTPLQKNIYQRQGYEFIGWKAYRLSDKKTCYVNKADTKKRKFFLENEQPYDWVPYIYKDACNVALLSRVDKDIITMYAQWEKIQLLDNAPEHVEKNKQILHDKLLQNPIVLYGGAKECQVFYSKYHDQLQIRCILLDDEDEIGNVSNCDVLVKKYNRMELNKKDFIVICRKVSIRLDNLYKTAKNNLVKSGRKITKDFIRQDIAQMILEHKKLWLWFGYCQLETLRKDIFQKLPSISSKYVLASFRYELDTLENSYKFDDCIELLKICDCLTYIPLLVADGKMDFTFKTYLPNDAKTVTIPRLPFRGYYPYRDSNMEVFHQYSTKIDGKPHWPFAYAEKAIDNLIMEGKSDDEIYAELMRDDFISETEIKKNLKMSYKFIEISESQTDITMLDFIKENLEKRMLYRDGLHYHNFMYFEIARRIARFMNLECESEINNLEADIEKKGIQFINWTEVPVLPCVAKVLNLNFITDETLWRVHYAEKGIWRGTRATIKEMTRKEWIYSYISYTRACIVLNDFWDDLSG